MRPKNNLQLATITILAWLLFWPNFAQTEPQRNFLANFQDEEVSLEIKDETVIFNGEEITYNTEKILSVEGGGYKDFFSGKDLYYCNATTVYASRTKSGELVIVVMDRSMPSKSYGYLCKLTMSTADFNEPSSFNHYLVRKQNGKLKITRTSALSSESYPVFKRSDIFTTSLYKNKELGAYIQRELDDGNTEQNFYNVSPRADRVSTFLTKDKSNKPAPVIKSPKSKNNSASEAPGTTGLEDLLTLPAD